jgi:16S rRNA processing protein RimM
LKSNLLTDIDLVRVGFFQKPHGITGTLLFFFEPDWINSIEDTSFLFVIIDGLPVPWAIEEEGIRFISTESAYINIVGIQDEKSAKKLCGKDVCIERIYASAAPSESWQFQWSGFTILEEDGKVFGKIIDGHDYAGNYVFSVEIKEGQCLVPYHPDLVVRVDRESKTVVMKVPAGLTAL